MTKEEFQRKRTKRMERKKYCNLFLFNMHFQPKTQLVWQSVMPSGRREIMPCSIYKGTVALFQGVVKGKEKTRKTASEESRKAGTGKRRSKTGERSPEKKRSWAGKELLNKCTFLLYVAKNHQPVNQLKSSTFANSATTTACFI